MTDAPDIYTNGWWRRQFRGFHHLLNQLSNDYCCTWDAVEELRKRCDTLEQRLSDMEAAIGELKESMDKAREAFVELRKGIGNHA